IRRTLSRNGPAFLHALGVRVGWTPGADGRQSARFGQGRVARAMFAAAMAPSPASAPRPGFLGGFFLSWRFRSSRALLRMRVRMVMVRVVTGMALTASAGRHRPRHGEQGDQGHGPEYDENLLGCRVDFVPRR